jgi:hypothetical protein
VRRLDALPARAVEVQNAVERSRPAAPDQAVFAATALEHDPKKHAPAKAGVDPLLGKIMLETIT